MIIEQIDDKAKKQRPLGRKSRKNGGITMKKYLQVKGEVMNILIEKPFTRDNDNALYVEYLRRNGYDASAFSAQTLLDLIDRGILPSIDCIGRARREAQRKNPDVQASITVAERRKHEFEENTEYFRSIK